VQDGVEKFTKGHCPSIGRRNTAPGIQRISRALPSAAGLFGGVVGHQHSTGVDDHRRARCRRAGDPEQTFRLFCLLRLFRWI